MIQCGVRKGSLHCLCLNLCHLCWGKNARQRKNELPTAVLYWGVWSQLPELCIDPIQCSSYWSSNYCNYYFFIFNFIKYQCYFLLQPYWKSEPVVYAKKVLSVLSLEGSMESSPYRYFLFWTWHHKPSLRMEGGPVDTSLASSSRPHLQPRRNVLRRKVRSQDLLLTVHCWVLLSPTAAT